MTNRNQISAQKDENNPCNHNENQLQLAKICKLKIGTIRQIEKLVKDNSLRRIFCDYTNYVVALKKKQIG